MQTKHCGTCKETKPVSFFSKNRAKLDGLHPQCKDCNKAWRTKHRERLLMYQKEYWQNNKKQLNKRKRLYRKENLYKLRDQQKQSRKRNRSWYQNYSKQYQKERKAIDAVFALTCKLRCRLTAAVRGKYKSGSAVQDLGMPIPAFLTYLNLDCLDKYGEPYTGNEYKYHIDHITPLSKFDLTDAIQIKKATNWTNLQVLSITDNLQKGARTTLLP